MMTKTHHQTASGHLLCVTSEHPERRLATDIEQPNHRILTSRNEQLTVRPEPRTVRGVLKAR